MREYQDTLLDPGKCALLVLDVQPQMFFGAEGSFQNTVMLHLKGLAKAARVFHVPCILSTIAATAFAGPLYSGVQEVFAQAVPIDRTSLNAFEDGNVRRAVESSSRKKLLLAGLWTEAGPARFFSSTQDAGVMALDRSSSFCRIRSASLPSAIVGW